MFKTPHVWRERSVHMAFNDSVKQAVLSLDLSARRARKPILLDGVERLCAVFKLLFEHGPKACCTSDVRHPLLGVALHYMIKVTQVFDIADFFVCLDTLSTIKLNRLKLL